MKNSEYDFNLEDVKYVELVFGNCEVFNIPMSLINSIKIEKLYKFDSKFWDNHIKKIGHLLLEINIEDYNKLSNKEKEEGYYKRKDIQSFNGSIYVDKEPIILKRLIKDNVNTSINYISLYNYNDELIERFGLPYNEGFMKENEDEFYSNYNANVKVDGDVIYLEVSLNKEDIEVVK